LKIARGIFWVGTQGDGLHIMDRKTGSFTRLTYDPNHPEKLSRPPVNKWKYMDHITFITEDMTVQYGSEHMLPVLTVTIRLQKKLPITNPEMDFRTVPAGLASYRTMVFYG
jgi:hypothetical protein